MVGVPIKLGVTWYAQNVHLASMTTEVILDPANPAVEFFPEDYENFDSDGDSATNVVEVGANSDPYDATDWPDVPGFYSDQGLIGTSGEFEAIHFGVVGVEVISQSEDSGLMVFTISRSGTTTLPINIDYETVEGSANTADYIETSGSLFWPVGSSDDQTIEVQLKTDSIIEDDEYFLLRLRNKDNPSDTSVFNYGSFAVGVIENAGGTDEWPADITSALYAGWYDASANRYGVSTNARVEILENSEFNVYRLLQDCYIKSTHKAPVVRSSPSTKIWDTSLFVIDRGVLRMNLDNGELSFFREGALDFKWPRLAGLGPNSPIDRPECEE